MSDIGLFTLAHPFLCIDSRGRLQPSRFHRVQLCRAAAVADPWHPIQSTFRCRHEFDSANWVRPKANSIRLTDSAWVSTKILLWQTLTIIASRHDSFFYYKINFFYFYLFHLFFIVDRFSTRTVCSNTISEPLAKKKDNCGILAK